MSYLFLGHRMEIEEDELRLPPPAIRAAYGKPFACKFCGAPGLRWWRNENDRNLPVNEYGLVHTCGGR